MFSLDCLGRDATGPSATAPHVRLGVVCFNLKKQLPLALPLSLKRAAMPNGEYALRVGFSVSNGIAPDQVHLAHQGIKLFGMR